MAWTTKYLLKTRRPRETEAAPDESDSRTEATPDQVSPRAESAWSKSAWSRSSYQRAAGVEARKMISACECMASPHGLRVHGFASHNLLAGGRTPSGQSFGANSWAHNGLTMGPLNEWAHNGPNPVKGPVRQLLPGERLSTKCAGRSLVLLNAPGDRAWKGGRGHLEHSGFLGRSQSRALPRATVDA